MGKDIIINGIDVSEYFIEVVDEGGSTIDYKIFPNSERLLVEKIFEQNQQLKRLQEENEKLKKKKNEYYLINLDYETKISYLIQALEEIKEMILGFGNTPIEFKTLNIPLKEEDLKTNEGKIFDFYKKLKDKINEALNDRD